MLEWKISVFLCENKGPAKQITWYKIYEKKRVKKKNYEL